MSAYQTSASSGDSCWVFYVGDLVQFAPSRVPVYDYDGYYYPSYNKSTIVKDEEREKKAIGIVIQVYEKYGYHADRYYKIKWADNGFFSNEKHENLILISHSKVRNKE